MSAQQPTINLTNTRPQRRAKRAPALDWAATHGPVSGALSATTGAGAIALLGAAADMPSGWPMAVGVAGALGHGIGHSLYRRFTGRTLATRAPHNHNTQNPTTGDTNMTDGMGSVFSESASEVESAAHSYDPEGAMHVLATIESLPAGLQSIANAFKVLAEKSDTELPLDPAVGEAINDVFDKLQQAIDVAESIPEIFRQKHEADIERIENPRNGAAAESLWDVGNNDV